MMDVPKDLDGLLRELADNDALRPEDRAFVETMLRSINAGSRGVFVVLHPDERMQYMILNTGIPGALGLLARVMQRTAERMETEP